MIEAEYKARLADAAAVLKQLESRAEPERVTYRDTYFDDAEGALAVVSDLGVSEDQFTSELYTDAVARSRRRGL